MIDGGDDRGCLKVGGSRPEESDTMKVEEMATEGLLPRQLSKRVRHRFCTKDKSSAFYCSDESCDEIEQDSPKKFEMKTERPAGSNQGGEHIEENESVPISSYVSPQGEIADCQSQTRRRAYKRTYCRESKIRENDADRKYNSYWKKKEEVSKAIEYRRKHRIHDQVPQGTLPEYSEKTSLERIDYHGSRYRRRELELTGRIWSKPRDGRSTLVDGHKWGNLIVSLALTDLPTSSQWKRGDMVTVKGRLTSPKDIWTLSVLEASKADEGQPMKEINLSGTVVPMAVAPEAIFVFLSAEDRQRFQDLRAEKVKRSGEIVRQILKDQYEHRIPLPMKPLKPNKGGYEQRTGNAKKEEQVIVCQPDFDEKKVKMDNPVKQIEWNEEPADSLTALSALSQLPIPYEGVFTLCVNAPTVVSYRTTQRVMMCDGEGSVFPVCFVGMAGPLPCTSRGTILEILGGRLSYADPKYQPTVFGHTLEIIVERDAVVKIITGAHFLLSQRSPANSNLKNLREGLNRSIANVRIVDIGGQAKDLYGNVNQQIEVADLSGNKMTMYFNKSDCKHIEHLQFGWVYDFFGLRVAISRVGKKYISSCALFGWKEKGRRGVTQSTEENLDAKCLTNGTKMSLQKIDLETDLLLDNDIEVSGRIWSKVHNGRAIFVDGHRMNGGGIACLWLTNLPSTTVFKKGDPVTVSGKLTLENGLLVIIASRISEDNSEDVMKIDDLHGRVVHMTDFGIQSSIVKCNL